MHKFSFMITPYLGFEDEVLRLRNENREIPQNRTYLDWRYLGLRVSQKPEIFWIKTIGGASIGMASMIYRPYWIGSMKYEFMILGDISINKEYRGTGLATDFFLFINEQIRKRRSPCVLVIPNKPAQKVLSRTGWHKKGRLIHHVLLLRPSEKIYSFIKQKSLSNFFSKFYEFFLNVKLFAIKEKDFSISVAENFDEPFDDFWNSYNKNNTCQKEMSSEYLQWRYGDYPLKKDYFFIVKCYRRNDFIAYLICAFNAEMHTCVIYDILTKDKRYIPYFIKLFIRFVQANENIFSIRVILNETHPYSDQFEKIGFSKRKEDSLFMVYLSEGSKGLFESCQWSVTAGDKDV